MESSKPKLFTCIPGIRGFANINEPNSKTASKNALPILANYAYRDWETHRKKTSILSEILKK